MRRDEPLTLAGLLGWSNKRGGIEFYRYDEKIIPRHDSEWGDLLAYNDAIAQSEGSPVIVVVLPRSTAVEEVYQTQRVIGEALQRAVVAPNGAVTGAPLRELIAGFARRHAEEFHYRDLFAEIEGDGHVIGGRDPLATFLTQLTRVEGIKPAGGNRSGRYVWRKAAESDARTQA